MSAERHSGDGSEFQIPQTGVYETPVVSAEAEEKWIYDVRQFREDVFAKLVRYGALQNGNGWATFDIFKDLSAGAGISSNREILLLTGNHPSAQSKGGANVPAIRILVNEKYSHTSVARFLTEDFTLDHEDDAQYFIDAFNVTNGKATNTQYAPIFDTKMDRLLLFNFRPSTPCEPLRVEKLGEVLPFGNNKNFADKNYALERAKTILAEVSGIEPSAAGIAFDVIRG